MHPGKVFSEGGSGISEDPLTILLCLRIPGTGNYMLTSEGGKGCRQEGGQKRRGKLSQREGVAYLKTH